MSLSLIKIKTHQGRPERLKRGKPGRRACRQGEDGFTLLEITIALVLMMIVCLGAASLFSYAVYYNSGGYDRGQALAIAQQATETLRNRPYTVSATDPLLAAATTTQTVYRGSAPGTSTGARAYLLSVTITDAASGSYKLISVTVTPQGAGQSWATGAAGAVTLETIRARTNE